MTPDRHLLVVDLGDYVVVPTWLATLLHEHPSSGINTFRRAVRGRDARVDQAMTELALAASAYLARRANPAHQGRHPAPRADPTQPSGRDSPKQLTTREAADQLGLSPRSVRRLVEDGRLPASRLGRWLVLDPRDVDAYRARRAG